MCPRQNIRNKEEEENPTESIGVVLAKYPPNIKLENFHNFTVPELELIMRTLFSEGFEFL